MGTFVRLQLPSSSKKTKASYAMISNFPNIHPTFPTQMSFLSSPESRFSSSSTFEKFHSSF